MIVLLFQPSRNGGLYQKSRICEKDCKNYVN